jgi:hypothetical protein
MPNAGHTRTIPKAIFLGCNPYEFLNTALLYKIWIAFSGFTRCRATSGFGYCDQMIGMPFRLFALFTLYITLAPDRIYAPHPTTSRLRVSVQTASPLQNYFVLTRPSGNAALLYQQILLSSAFVLCKTFSIELFPSSFSGHLG